MSAIPSALPTSSNGGNTSPTSSSTPVTSPIGCCNHDNIVPVANLRCTDRFLIIHYATSAHPTSTLVVVTTATASQYTATTSGGVVVTVYTTPSCSTTFSRVISVQHRFWSNTAAVAGVFSVVGLIGLALFILLVTTATRRRQVIKFDKEIAAAAAEAAKSTPSPFDDFSESGGGDYGYSDNGCGAYGMGEVAQSDLYVASAVAAVERARSKKESKVGVPSIAGVGAGNLAREPSRRAPCHAFAGPNSQAAQDPASNLSYPCSTATQDILEAAGLAGTGAAAMANNRGRAFINPMIRYFTKASIFKNLIRRRQETPGMSNGGSTPTHGTILRNPSRADLASSCAHAPSSSVYLSAEDAVQAATTSIAPDKFADELVIGSGWLGFFLFSSYLLIECN
ncbi:hypothetical protein ID866_10960 [Astraeus odoratus]|nr:hypothetical protein ID866_10960 [Astraeus odoratus]